MSTTPFKLDDYLQQLNDTEQQASFKLDDYLPDETGIGERYAELFNAEIAARQAQKEKRLNPIWVHNQVESWLPHITAESAVKGYDSEQIEKIKQNFVRDASPAEKGNWVDKASDFAKDTWHSLGGGFMGMAGNVVGSISDIYAQPLRNAEKAYQNALSDRAQVGDHLFHQQIEQAKTNDENEAMATLRALYQNPSVAWRMATGTIPQQLAVAFATGGVGLGAVNAAASAGDYRNTIKEAYENTLKNNPAQISTLPEIQSRMAQGMTLEQAVNDAKTDYSDNLGGIARAAAIGAMDRWMPLGRIGEGINKGIVKTLAKEVGSEALQEGVEQANQNYGKGYIDGETKLLDDVQKNAAMGGVLGFGMGVPAAVDAYKNRNITGTKEKVDSDALINGLTGQNAQPTVTPNPQPSVTPTAQPTPAVQPTAQPNPTPAVQPSAQSNLQQTANIAPTAPRNVLQGAEDSIDIGDNNYQPFQYEVMEADDLAPTQQKDDNQYRDRNRTASQTQINKMARHLDPRKLAESPTMDLGAPLLAQDGKTVIAGNGRSMAIRQAYDENNSAGYRQYLQENAAKFGLDENQIAGMNKPVLVRRLKTAVDIQQTAINSNEQGGMRMSNLEQAKVDAQRLPFMANVELNENGDLNTPANQGFITKFIQNQPESLRNELLDKDGRLSQTGVQRLRNAMLYKAFGDTETLARAVESTDQGARNIVNALTRIAPEIAQVKQDIASGFLKDVDISNDIVQAVEKYNQLKGQNQNIDEYLNQQDFVGELSPEAKGVLRIFNENNRSAKRIAEILGSYYRAARTQGNATQDSLFGESDFDKAGTLEQAKSADLEERYSRSPIKSVEANIKRGRVAMNKAIAERRTIHRAMFNHNLDGWVDFEWGDDGLTKPFNKKGEPVGKGISHIIEARMRKDGMSYDQVVRMLTQDIVETLARGSIAGHWVRNEGKSESIQIDYNGHRAGLIRNKGSNAWLLTAFELYPTDVNSAGSVDTERTTNTKPTLTRQGEGAVELNSNGEQRVGFDTTEPTHSKPTLTRQGMGAFDTDNVQQTPTQSKQLTQDHASLSRILGEDTAQHIELIDSNTQKPTGQDVKQLVSEGVEGWFDRRTQKIYLLSDGIEARWGLTREERLAWVAWHELAHAGVNVKYGNKLNTLLETAGKNKLVAAIARRIQREQGYNKHVALEEALVEIYAAHETGNWHSLETRYNITINERWRSGKDSVGDFATKMANYFRRLINVILGKNAMAETMTTSDVFKALRGVSEGIANIGEQTSQRESDGVRYSFAGENARNADRTSLEKAKADVANGKNAESVRKETGWFQGVDGKWRFELDSSQFTLNPNVENGLTETVTPLNQVIDAQSLFEAYPEFAQLYIVKLPEGERSYYSPREDAIFLRSELKGKELKSVLMHEIQHAIQERENFARGGSDKNSHNIVRNLRDNFLKETQFSESLHRQAQDLLDNEANSSRKLQEFVAYDAARQLRYYANSDSITRSARHVFNNAHIIDYLRSDIHNGKLNVSDEVKTELADVSKLNYHLPKRTQKGYEMALRQYAQRAANAIEQTISESSLTEFNADPRSSRAITTALKRAYRKAHEELAPLNEAKSKAQRAEALYKQHSLSTPYDIYLALGGEVEARNVQNRLDMTAEERRNTSPESTEDVARSKQIPVLPQENGRWEVESYSLNEESDSDFAKAVDAFVEGNEVKTSISMGTTPDVLKMIGLPDVEVKIKRQTLSKVMRGRHSIEPETLKQLPQQMNDPVGVFKSAPHSSNPDGYVVLTELTEFNQENQRDEPVIAALHLNKKGEVQLIDIASVYGKNHQGLQNILNKDKAFYWNKTKGSQLANVHWLQLPLKLRSDANLSANDIKTETDLSQYQSENSVKNDDSENSVDLENGEGSDVRFSRSENLTRADYDQAKANGETELDFNQWKQVRSPEFKRWFGDWENDPDNASKVVNPRTGEPLVVYRSDSATFNKFDKRKARQGFFFTTSKDVAQMYGNSARAFFLNIRNPLITEKALPNQNNALDIKGLDYDGVLNGNVYGKSDEYIAINPNQIKSATDNNGDFSSENDDIRFSRAKPRSTDVDFENATPKRTANSFEEARAAVTELLGEPLVNRESGMIATISKRSLEKLVSGKATKKSSSTHDHLMAVANVDQLFENAIQGWVEPHRDDDPNIAGIHRLFAPLNIDGKMKLVKLTVKEMNFNQDNRIYSVETIEVDNGTLGNLEATANQNDQLTSPQSANIRSLIQRIQDFNSRDENSDIRYSKKQSAANLAQTGKAQAEPSILDDLKARDFDALKKRLNQATGKVDEWIADSLRPVNDWIDTFKSNGIHEMESEGLKQDMYRAKGVRDALNSEFEQHYLKPLMQEVAKIAKKNKLDELSAKRMVGFWMSTRYAIEKNNELLTREHQAMLDAKKAWDDAIVQGVGVKKAENAYLEAEQQYLDRKHDVELALNSTADFKVGTAGGWSNAEAADIMQNIEKRIPHNELMEAAKYIYRLNQARLKIDFESGRYTAAEFNEYSKNTHYVPLTGDPNQVNDFDGISGAGQNSLNITKDRALKGRKLSEAEDAIDASWRAIGRSTTYKGWADFKNRLDDLYERRVAELENQGYSHQAAVEETEKTLGISKQEMQGTTRTSDNALIRKHGGKYYEYRLPDKVMTALKNDNVEHANAFLSLISKPTSWYARGVTQWTVTFAPMNMMRDTWEKSEFIRVQKLFDANGKQLDAKTMASIGRAVLKNAFLDKGVWNATKRFGFGDSLTHAGNDAKLLKELLDLGGVSTYSTYLAKTETDLIKQIKQENSVMGKRLEKAGSLLEGYNKTFDTVSALAAYKAMIEHGVDPKQAAATTLELTNFRKTGSKMRGIKALYMFSQPTAMGARNLIKYLSTSTGRKRFVGYMAVMIPLYLTLRAFDDEDEGGNKMDQLGDITRYIPIPAGLGHYLKIPVGFGMPQLAWNFATNIVKAAVGDISYSDALVNMAVHSSKTIAPISPSEIPASKHLGAKAALTATPTILQPLMQIVLDRTAFGSKLTPGFVVDNKLKAEQSKSTTAKFWKDTALFLSDTLGIDMHPEQIKNLFDGYGSVLGSFKELQTILIENPNREQLGRRTKIPFLNQFIGTTNEFSIQSRYYEAAEEARNLANEYKSRKERGNLQGWATPEIRQKVRFHELAEKRMKELQAKKAKLTKALNAHQLSDTAYNARLKGYNKQVDGLQRVLLKRWRKMEGLNTTE